MLVLQEVFEQVALDLKNQGQEVHLSNGKQSFENIASALNALGIFQ